jgi:hypothetical protein
MASERVVRVDRNLVAVPRSGKRRFRRRYSHREVGTKGVLLIAGAGAIVALLANLDDLKNSESVKSHWWLLPLGVLAIGYMLRKRGNPYGTAVLAVGGALFAIAYQIQSKHAAAAPKPPAPAPQQFAPDVQGPYMASLPDVGAMPGLPTGYGRFAWIQTPDGQMVRIPMPAGAGYRKGGFNQQRPANAAG